MVEAEKFAQRVLNTSLNGIYIHDVKLGQNVFINNQYTALTGYSIDDLRAMDNAQFFELFHPDDRQQVAAHIEELVDNGDDMREIEYRFKTKDGRWIWCLSRDSVFERTEDGSVSQFIGTFLDITERKQLEEDTIRLRDAAIRERDQLKALVNSISDEIWFADNKGKFTLVNPSGALEFAVSEAGEIDVKKFAESLQVYRPDGSPRPVEEAPPLRSLQGEVVRNQEEIIRTPATGELRYRQVSSAPVRERAGSIIGSVSVVRDITDSKRAEEALRDSEEQLKRAEEIAHLGSWELDLLRNRLAWSDEVYCIFGLQPQEFGASYESFLEYVHPGDRAAVNAAFSDSVREGRNTYEIEHRVIRKSTGEVRWVQEKCHHVRDASGRATRSLGMVLDITDRKKTEQVLKKAYDELEKKVKERTYELEATVRALELEIEERKEAESRLHQLARVFMDAADPIIIESLSGTILDMNRQAESAYSWKRQDLIGKSIKSIIPQECHQQAEQMRQCCLNGEEVRNWEDLRQDQFGRKFFVLVTAFPLNDECGKPVAVATIAKDITFRKQMEADLEKSHQRLRDLSLKSIEALESDRRNVARELHDSIGGSLAAIKFSLEAVVEEIGKNTDQTTASLQKSISYLADTIKETKRITANLRPLSIDDLGLLATIEWHSRQFSQQYSHIEVIKQIEICEEEIPNSLKIVVYRVLQEALNNCAKHSMADTVHIGLRKKGNEIEFELKDNGCGFNAEEVLNRDDPLIGNGLKNMQERAEICGGLFCLDTKPGTGTTIRFLFPLT